MTAQEPGAAIDAQLRKIERKVLAVLKAFSDDLAALITRVDDLEEQLQVPKARRLPGTPVVWHLLPPADRQQLWPRFVDWVIWLADNHELTPDQLPRCWSQHGAVITELTALWTGYLSAHDPDKGDAGAAPHQWNDALARALDRIRRTWLGECTTGEHTHKKRAPWSQDHTYLQDLLAALPPATPPTPTTTTSGPADAGAGKENP